MWKRCGAASYVDLWRFGGANVMWWGDGGCEGYDTGVLVEARWCVDDLTCGPCGFSRCVVRECDDLGSRYVGLGC